MVYDLEDRTLKFAVKIVELCGKGSKNVITIPIISQLVRSGTSIGANVIEAQHSLTRKGFENYYRIALRSANETRYWLELIDRSDVSDNSLDMLISENEQLTKILAAIIIKLRRD